MAKNPVQLMQLNLPDWGTVKNEFNAVKSTRPCKIHGAITGIASLGMIAANLLPGSAVVQFFGAFGLGCFFPMLNMLYVRKWNRTLALPVALLCIAIALLTMLIGFSFGGLLATLLLCVAFMFGASSDLLTPIYQLKPPLNHIVIIAAALLLCLVVYLMLTIFAFAISMVIFVLAMVFLLVWFIFGGRRRW